MMISNLINTSYEDNQLEASMEYSYQVSATNSFPCGESNPSNSVSNYDYEYNSKSSSSASP